MLAVGFSICRCPRPPQRGRQFPSALIVLAMDIKRAVSVRSEQGWRHHVFLVAKKTSPRQPCFNFCFLFAIMLKVLFSYRQRQEIL